MANKKRYINTEAELLKAMRSTGYCFPTNQFEQKSSFKIQKEIDIEELSKAIDPEAIWNSTEPIEYKKPTIVRELNTDTPIKKEWGIAAKGSANISKEIMDKIKRNQNKNKQ